MASTQQAISSLAFFFLLLTMVGMLTLYFHKQCDALYATQYPKLVVFAIFQRNEKVWSFTIRTM